MPSRNALMSQLNLSPEEFADYVVRQGLDNKEKYSEEEAAQLSQPYQTSQGAAPNTTPFADEAFVTLGDALQRAKQSNSMRESPSPDILSSFSALKALGGDSATLAMQYAVEKFTLEQQVQGLGEEFYQILVRLAAQQQEEAQSPSANRFQANAIRGNVSFFHHLETSLRNELLLPPLSAVPLTSGN